MPGTTRRGPLSKGNITTEVAVQGLEIVYRRMLAKNMAWLVDRLTHDKTAAGRYLAEYEEFEGMNWSGRLSRDLRDFLGLDDKEFLNDYFNPELRKYLMDLHWPEPEIGMNPNDRYALYQYRAGQEGRNLDLLLRDRTAEPAPRTGPKRDRDEDEPRSRIKSGKVTKGKVGSHLDDDEPKTYGRQGASSNTVDPDYGNSGRESQARKRQRNSDNGSYDSHNDGGSSGDGSSGGAPSGGAPPAPTPSGGGAPSGNAAPGSGGPPSGAGPAPDPGHGKLNKLDADPPSGGGGGDPSKRV
ncbi:hypothetical protein [Spirillospora sp. NPDC029432]|uniref:hypothetical protein n=1 Tax=Spirillospora sp. NPDC029432 TaxID=3154599 RepID=UPI0034548E1D